MDNQQLPIIPAEVEAEMALLGCIFLEPTTFEVVYGFISAADFYDAKNKMIFQAMQELTETNIRIDITTVVGNLTSHNILEQAGGMEYISEIAMRGYSTENVDSYTELVVNASLRRRAISKLQDLSNKGYDNKITTPAYLDNIESEMFDISKKRTSGALTHIKEVTNNVLTDVERKASQEHDIIGLDTGFNELNKITQGFQKDQLIILAARPSMGKTAFALNLAWNVATNNKNRKASVAVFSLEMSPESLVERLIACDSSIALGDIRLGKIAKGDWQRFNTSCSKAGALNIFFDGHTDLTTSKIRSKCRKLKESNGLDFVIVDYLQLIGSDKDDKSSQVEKITKISRSLKLMALDLHIPVMALSQLSRKLEERKDGDRRPQMSDLRDSGAIEQDADIIMLLYRDEVYRPKTTQYPGEAELIVAKNRSGSTGELIYRFNGPHQKFTEYHRENNKQERLEND